MVKSLLTAALTLSSLAFAAPGWYHEAAAPPPPPPRYAPAMPPRPVVVPPRPVAPVAPGWGNGEYIDVARATRLLRELDAAIARRDLRAVNELDWRMGRYLGSELNETRREVRGGVMFSRVELRQLRQLRTRLDTLAGRFGPPALYARRDLYAQVAALARHEVVSSNRF